MVMLWEIKRLALCAYDDTQCHCLVTSTNYIQRTAARMLIFRMTGFLYFFIMLSSFLERFLY